MVKKIYTIPHPIRNYLLKLLSNYRVWLFIIATLFASKYTYDNKIEEILAALISLWIMIILWLSRRY